jgi:hypothetical protein
MIRDAWVYLNARKRWWLFPTVFLSAVTVLAYLVSNKIIV